MNHRIKSVAIAASLCVPALAHATGIPVVGGPTNLQAAISQAQELRTQVQAMQASASNQPLVDVSADKNAVSLQTLATLIQIDNTLKQLLALEQSKASAVAR
ncbi:hypothetical protein [Burkholderia ubonensis]|uniref:hypothetical protein n=1 Tax=Burkholderia ubonensis TaxID=101571 RepID=UPI000B1C3766|nr:hypothetical protein [Burkholderia ubonensis]